MIDELYSREILRRTTQLQHVGHLANPQAVADKVAKLCGSTIHVELNMDGDVITDFDSARCAASSAQGRAGGFSTAFRRSANPGVRKGLPRPSRVYLTGSRGDRCGYFVTKTILRGAGSAYHLPAGAKLFSIYGTRGLVAGG
jgi:hypothetical protein